MSPGSLEAQGLISASEYQKVAALTQSASPDAHKKIAGKVVVVKRILVMKLKKQKKFTNYPFLRRSCEIFTIFSCLQNQSVGFTDFFGRVKDKAGDVERILKEKDRHGIVYSVTIVVTLFFYYIFLSSFIISTSFYLYNYYSFRSAFISSIIY